MKKIFLIFFVCLVLFLLFLSSCMKDNPKLSYGNEEFTGTYMVRNYELVDRYTLIDSVHFTFLENRRYSMNFYESVNSQDDVNFCNHYGTVLDFGTAKAIFSPDLIIQERCNFMVIPQGTFSADFINHGDTIIIMKRVIDLNASNPYDSIYILTLFKLN